jgi:hypothetical protein
VYIIYIRESCYFSPMYTFKKAIKNFEVTITNKTEYVVHKLNFTSHSQPIQIRTQSDEVIKARVQVFNCINVKPKSERVSK